MTNSTKIALCIGNNHFVNFPDNSLQGCENDANDSANFFRGLGFTTTVLTNTTEAQTKEALAALKPNGVWPSGARILIWFSSHGSQIDDPTGHNGLSEVSCCSDFDGVSGCVSDHWWGAYLQNIPDTTRVYLMADTCHSADVTREIGWKPRYLFNPRIISPPDKRRNMFTAIATILDRYVDIANTYPGILFSGCDEDGTSADATFNGRSNGAFTYYALDTLHRASNYTNRSLLDQINKGLKAHRYPQHSHLQCHGTLANEPFLLPNQ